MTYFRGAVPIEDSLKFDIRERIQEANIAIYRNRPDLAATALQEAANLAQRCGEVHPAAPVQNDLF